MMINWFVSAVPPQQIVWLEEKEEKNKQTKKTFPPLNDLTETEQKRCPLCVASANVSSARDEETSPVCHWECASCTINVGGGGGKKSLTNLQDNSIFKFESAVSNTYLFIKGSFYDLVHENGD